MKVFVTGANGLLATNTIIHLLACGYRVRGLVRDPEKFLLPLHERLDLSVGDIADTHTLRRAMDDCDYVIHCAATTDQSLLRYADYHRVNVLGTQNVVDAALENKVKKIVYVGTSNTAGYGTMDAPGDEMSPPRSPFIDAWYAKSKMEAQELVLAAKSQIAVVVVSPTFMIGPYDGKPSSGKIILMGYGKNVVFHPPGGKNFVNAEDAAIGVVKALEKGKNGETYLLAGDNLSYRQFFRLLAAQTGSKPFLIALPKPLVLAAGYVGDLLRALGVKTALSSANMRILCVKNYYSNRKAAQELGLSFHPIEQGVSKAIAWFKNQKML